jgi:hypothetical protein
MAEFDISGAEASVSIITVLIHSNQDLFIVINDTIKTK